MTAPFKQEKEHRLRHSHTTHIIHMWVSSLYCWGSESVCLACSPGPFTLNKLFTSTSVVSQFHRQELLPWNSTQTQSAQHKHALKSSPWFYHWGKAPWGSFSSHSDWPHRSSWPLCDTTRPNLSSSSDPWQNPFVWQTKYSTHQVLHSDDNSTHTLHPIPGYSSVLHKKDRYQSYSPVITNKLSVPIPACLNSLIHPAPEHKL